MRASGAGGAVLVAASLASACRGEPTGPRGAIDAAAPVDAATLPETVVIVLEAGAEPGRPALPPKKITLLSGLPRPCQDRALGTVTFAQEDDNVIITSSRTRARATCTPEDPTTLRCDWVGTDGKPTVTGEPVTHGPKKKIGGRYEKARAFSCPPQS